MDVTIDGNYFIIDDKKYIGTEDLWKLLTLKNPGKPSDADLETYREILLKTKPFLQEHTDRVKCNRLTRQHRILLGAFQIGNNGVFNELNAINDKLLELDIFDFEVVEKLNNIVNGNS